MRKNYDEKRTRKSAVYLRLCGVFTRISETVFSAFLDLNLSGEIVDKYVAFIVLMDHFGLTTV